MKEFIVLMASLMALVALSIDAVLPAFGAIQLDLHVERENSVQLVIGVFFAGMMFGYIIYGQLADAIGRKPSLYCGLGLYIVGCLVSIFSQSLFVLLIGRFIQGVGLAAPRILTITIVRDKYQGRDMAQVMSLIMGIFILVPIVAPSVGQLILFVSDWRGIFTFFVGVSIIVMIWLHFRQEETLTPEKRSPFSLTSVMRGFRACSECRFTLGYSIASGFAFACLLAYLSSAKQIFNDIYEVGDMFAVYFGILAMGVGVAFFVNSALVKRFGMRKITNFAIHILLVLSALFLPFVMLSDHVPLFVFIGFAWLCFFGLGLMFGNMGAMALEPMGHIAGLASAYVGFVSTGISIVLGVVIGQLYDGTLLPISLGFLLMAICTKCVILWTEKGHIEEDIEASA